MNSHITVSGLKFSKNLNAICHLSSSMSLEKRRTVMKKFVESQFKYCPLIWVRDFRTLNNEINCIHERALRAVYSDYKSSFHELLDKNCSFTIHQKNI